MEGWILLHRKLIDNGIWTSEPFTRGQAWVDLLMIASHAKSVFYIRGNKVEVNIGEVAWSEEKLSSRWRWSRTKLRGFLKHLKNEQQIIQHNNNIINIIAIVNYKQYQKKDDRLDNRKTAEEQQKNIYKECIKNYNNVKELNRWDEIFDLWLSYKAEKKECYKKRGMDAMIKKLFKFSDDNHEIAMEIITNAISNNYSGFFELKHKPIKSNQNVFTEADFNPIAESDLRKY